MNKIGNDIASGYQKDIERLERYINMLQAENAMNEKLLNATLDVVNEQKAEIAALRDVIRTVLEHWEKDPVMRAHTQLGRLMINALKAGEE